MFRPSAVTADSSFTHSRGKDCSRALGEEHARPHTDGSSTPTTEVPPPALVHTRVPQLLADALSTTAELSRSRATHAGARHFRCDREGSRPGQNGGFLIQNYTVGVSFVASGMSMPVLPNFTSLSLSQKGLHPAEQKKGESTHQEYLDDEAIAWEPRWSTGSDRQSHTDKLLHQTAAQVYSSARHGLNVQI